ncbi:amylo-alpha-1,6-glucosidase [Pararhodonellum marinum]|uniref:amylo-alpha-1,6-glucosidase n=1 Tax=Pararhodonellum marinum TaxID=2755358 RepID=UPI00188E3C5D|nr:glycoside hydrolase 100 family protein [Pararhodonellum marinum]
MDLQIAQNQALSMMRKASHPRGFLASSQTHDNYKRVWARDGIITGLAALSSREADLMDTFEETLITLGDFISPEGHIPSNVDLMNGQVSYGGLAGRADTGTWWMIGLCLFAKYTGKTKLLEKFESEVNRIHQLYKAWEYNNRGLIYVPIAGDWADEYVLQGYVLYDQVLRYGALRLSGEAFNRKDWLAQAEKLHVSIVENYWLDEGMLEKGIHPVAKKRLWEVQGELPYLMASFHPAGYQTYFDALGNALAILFNIHPNPQKTIKAFSHNGFNLVPAFSPAISPQDPDYRLLEENYRFKFRNHPNEFHNGGIWPMVNGFWGMAVYKEVGKAEAMEILKKLIEKNSEDSWEFNECFHALTGKPCGVPSCTWSAAGQVLLQNTIHHGFYLLD